MTKKRVTAKPNKRDVKVEMLVVLAVLISLGFPGSYTVMTGKKVGTMLEYAAFGIELLAMALSSGDHWLDIQLLNLNNKYWGLYVFGAVIFVDSMLVTRYPNLQMITCIRLLVTLLFAIWMQETFTFERMIELLCIAQAIFVFASLVFIVIRPGEAFETGKTYINALKGIYPSKNSYGSEILYGMMCTMMLIRLKLEKAIRPTNWEIMLGIQLIMLLMCQATGVLLSLVLLGAFAIFLRQRRYNMGWIFIAVSVGFIFGILTLIPYFAWFFELLGKDATLTGRIPLWNQIIQVMSYHHTFTGFGYGMFWRDSRAVALIHAGFDQNSFFSHMTTGAHNMLLELWANIGLIGIGAFFMMILKGTAQYVRLPKNQYVFSSMILAYIMLNGLTERCISSNYDYKVFSLFLAVAIGSNIAEVKKKKCCSSWHLR